MNHENLKNFSKETLIAMITDLMEQEAESRLENTKLSKQCKTMYNSSQHSAKKFREEEEKNAELKEKINLSNREDVPEQHDLKEAKRIKEDLKYAREDNYKLANSKARLQAELANANGSLKNRDLKMAELRKENERIHNQMFQLQEDLDKSTNYTTGLSIDAVKNEAKTRMVSQILKQAEYYSLEQVLPLLKILHDIEYGNCARHWYTVNASDYTNFTMSEAEAEILKIKPGRN